MNPAQSTHPSRGSRPSRVSGVSDAGAAAASQSAPAGLLLAEEVLRRLREVVRDTDLWFSSAWNSNEMLGPGVSFANLVLHDEASFSGQEFLGKHWLRADGAEVDATAFFVARQASPAYLTLRTTARWAYAHVLPQLAQALDGLAVSLEESTSWTWDAQEKTRTGEPRHRTVYVLTVSLDVGSPFVAKRWLKTAGEQVCASADERADWCMFQLVRDAKMAAAQDVFSYSRTRAGFEVECASLKAAQGLEKLFSDCAVKVRERAGRHDPWRVDVHFPG